MSQKGCTLEKPLRLPDWFRTNRSKKKATDQLAKRFAKEVPDSICEEAKCPNRSECFAKGVMTFMILGTVCTRNCSFCSVDFGKPLPPDPNEYEKIVKAVRTLQLKFVVLTSPNRDDLKDEGSGQYAKIVTAIKLAYPDVKVEVLIPDFKGKLEPLETVVDSRPHVLNHNIETVPSLYKTVRKGSLYVRSLELLNRVKDLNPNMLTKTGVMVGLGETKEELKELFRDVKKSRVDIFTMGQYLKPNPENHDVIKYYHPDEFQELKAYAEEAGIRYVFSGPLVRSSYMAEHVFENLNEGRNHELVNLLNS